MTLLPISLACLEGLGEHIKKISTVGECAMVLHMVGDIMYRKESDIDNDLVDWALQQLDKITNIRPCS